MRTTSALVIIQLLCAGSQALRLTSLGSLYEDEAPIQKNNHENGPSSAAGDDISNSYGVDRSFPIQHDNLLDDGPFHRRERQKSYHFFMDGCRARESNTQKGRCNQAEADRIATNLNQPARMKNYTKVGYEKVAVPTKLVESLNHFWKTHERDIPAKSFFETGRTEINHWAAGQFTMDIDDEKYHSKHLRGLIWEEAKPILEKFAGVELSPSSLYGLQIYTHEAVMPHRLDTLPFVINAIIHVADNIDKPWPIEVYGHDGFAKNITLEAGNMLLYEGQSVIMGRPYPMKGQYQAEIFISFEPLGYSRHHDQQQNESSLSSLYLNSWQEARVAKRDLIDKTVVPPYIANSFWEDNAYGRWKQDHPKAKLNIEGVKTITVHTAAADGDLVTLQALEKENSDSIFFVDENGWTALHEAVRGGHINVAEYLISKGLDINFRTHKGTGGSPLWWAKHIHGKNHEMVHYLKGRGAKLIAPDEDK